MNILLISEIEWCLFKRSFEKNLTIFNVDNQKETMKKAKLQYNQITKDIPAFGSNDALLTTLLNASILAAIYLSLPEKHDVELVKEYYKKTMNKAVMKLMLRKNNNFTKAYQRNLAKLATKSQKSNNSYAWKFKFIKGESLDSFDAIFEQCGICTLYKKWVALILFQHYVLMITIWLNKPMLFLQESIELQMVMMFVIVITKRNLIEKDFYAANKMSITRKSQYQFVRRLFNKTIDAF